MEDVGHRNPHVVNQLAVDPASGAHLIAATNDGLYQTSDSGAHWLATGPAQAFFESVAFAPSGGVVYATEGDVMYSSSDNGSTWALGGEVFTSGCYSSNEGIAVDPTTSTTLYVASGYCSSGIAKSTNGRRYVYRAHWLSFRSNGFQHRDQSKVAQYCLRGVE